MILVAAVTLASYAAAEETAVEVFKKVQGSVVALSNLEGSGTGIILDKTGLILTNAHVVNSPLPYKCKVDVIKRGGKSVTVTFKRVVILGVHPKADLALVRIDPKEHGGALQPAKIAKHKATPGQQVFAIGNPSAGGQVLNKSITQGILSGVDRIVKGEEGVKYYQVDAAINPGNSGGPLCDKEGRVLGVVTLKFEDADNTGYAIPLYELDTTVFVPAKKRKGDPARSKLMIEQASKYYKMAKDRVARHGKDDEGAEYYYRIAAFFYHKALTHDPLNHSIYYNFGMLLRTLDADEAAAAYLLQAIQLAPWADDNEYYYRELGYSLVKQKKMKEARVVWEEGIAKYPRTAAKI
jgi:tetratricopeptide (TPR) repeat protein